jgi:hypothetical protein
MSKRKKRWLIISATLLTLSIAAIFIAASILSKRFEPLIRDQAVRYLSDRFNSDVQIADLKIQMPKLSVPDLILSRGKGTKVHVQGTDVTLSMRDASNLPPLLAMRKFTFDLDLGILTEERKIIDHVSIEGLSINIPPKGSRPDVTPDQPQSDKPRTSVLIQQVSIQDFILALHPRDPKKTPLTFDIARLDLASAGNDVAMKYDATLTIPKPPGNVESQGSFGPWNTPSPGDTPLEGSYTYTNADLGVFRGIGGTLKSNGHFEGTLSSLRARGEASVPNFHLKRSGNTVPLHTNFEALIDGTNGDTVLRPVRARLGSTSFTTAGSVIRREDLGRRAIGLNVNMPNGNLPDLLRLAMKGTPFMEGRITLKTKINIPPLTGKVVEKLRLDGTFEVRDAKFLRANIQEQIDQLSRRGQGQPKNLAIDDVVSLMRGSFRLENEIMTFRSLTFGVPGADVDLAGNVNLDQDQIDLRGALRLRAKVSQTMTGWKRWALKPIDPFFSKKGAGTYLRIKVDGTSKQPKFGLDRKRKNEGEAARSN